jgi:gliding motility-associated-like protein
MFVFSNRKLWYGLVVFLLIHPNIFSQTPGGVTSSTLKLWFKADQGVVQAGGQVSRWDDISAQGNIITQPQKTANAHVLYKPGNANFNPTVTFDGTRLEQLKGTSNNLGGTPTLFTVTRSTNASAFNPVFSNFEYDRTQSDVLGKKVGPGLYLAADYYVVDANEAWLPNTADAPVSSNQLDIISFMYEDPGSTNNSSIYKNGFMTERYSGAGKPNTSNIKTIEIGGRSADDPEYPGRIFNGDIVEIIYFTDNLHYSQRFQVESYLAIKYGITLRNHYFNSSGVVIYDVNTFANNIIGIGRDDASALYQKQSKGENYTPIITIALNAIAADNKSNPGIFGVDKTTFITGSDNAPMTATTVGIPPGIDSWLERKWKGMLTGGPVSNLLISIPDTYLSTLIGSCELKLIMADDPGFTTNVQTFPMTQNGTSHQAIISSYTHSTAYFTFGITGALDIDFSYKQDICNPLSVQFFSAGGSTQNPYWAFGDGNIAVNNLTPVHAYSAYGNYTARFAVQNGACTDTIEKVISIAVANNDMIITPDTTICNGSGKQLRTKSALNFCWSPATYLDNPNSPNPTSTAAQNITYFFTAEVPGNNLITNGNFSAGNSGFTSQYNYSSNNITEGQYFVSANPPAWNGGFSNCGDHSTGTGNMMLVNGSPVADVNVWTATVAIMPNTNYAFSTWIQALYPPNPAQLQFSINGKTVGNLITASLPTCTWTQFYTTWNSGNNTTATISIVNKNTQIQGNDFALDDISFAPVLILRDSVKIEVEKPAVKTNNDTTVCANNLVQLYTTGASTYIWSPSAGLSNSTIGNPVATPSTTTEYIVTGTTTNGCTAKDTVLISTYTKPLITLTNDTAICPNSSVTLSVSGGSSYQWSPASSLDNPNSANPVASPADPTTYTVLLTDAHSCNFSDSVKVDFLPRPSFTASPNKSVCVGDTVHLSASGGDIYSWSPATYLIDPSVANTVAFPEADILYSVHIAESTCGYDTMINVTINVNPNPVVTAQKSNDIDCTTPSAQLHANGAETYLWSPASRLDNPDLASPLATTDTTTTFMVKGTNQFGCFAFDTITVKVTQTGKPLFVVPNAFTPNNDGKNDCFGIRKWGGVQIQEFSIFNRWGERIFTAKNPSDCWNGMYKGKYQDNGGYGYVIKARSFCGQIVRTGVIMLIR